MITSIIRPSVAIAIAKSYNDSDLEYAIAALRHDIEQPEAMGANPDWWTLHPEDVGVARGVLEHLEAARSHLQHALRESNAFRTYGPSDASDGSTGPLLDPVLTTE